MLRWFTTRKKGPLRGMFRLPVTTVRTVASVTSFATSRKIGYQADQWLMAAAV